MSGFDTVITGGSVIDGAVDAVPTRADVGIVDGRIEAVGDLRAAERRTTVDASGSVVAPGFIDGHTHVEMASLFGLADQFAPLDQGVTTTMVGADGFGWVGLDPTQRRRWWEDTAAIYGPLPDAIPDWDTPAEFLADIRNASLTSVVPLVPHCNVRAAVMGDRPGTADATEIAAMRKVIGDWMDEGAVGMATGLDYLPGRYADVDELVALCQTVAERGGVYASHVRNLDFGRADAWREAGEIGRRANIPLRFAHERLDEEGAALLDEVSVDNDVTVDVHLYPAGVTSLAFHVPPEHLAAGVMPMSAKLRSDRQLRQQLAAHLTAQMTGRPGQEAIVAATMSRKHEGRMLSEIAAERGCTVGDVAVQLLIDEMPSALLVYVWQAADAIWDETMERSITDPRTIVATDGVYLGSSTHPRGWGTFPRILGEFARDRAMVPLATAVHKMTGKTADAYGLTDRGRIAPGLRADITVFDPATVGSLASLAEPRVAPTGIEMVMVGGRDVTGGNTNIEENPAT